MLVMSRDIICWQYYYYYCRVCQSDQISGYTDQYGVLIQTGNQHILPTIPCAQYRHQWRHLYGKSLIGNEIRPSRDLVRFDNYHRWGVCRNISPTAERILNICSVHWKMLSGWHFLFKWFIVQLKCSDFELAGRKIAILMFWVCNIAFESFTEPTQILVFWGLWHTSAADVWQDIHRIALLQFKYHTLN